MKSRGWTEEDVRAATDKIRASRAAGQGRPAPAMLSSLTVTLPRLMPGLNGSSGLIRQHYRKATAAKDDLLAWVKSQRFGSFGKARVLIVCTRHYCGNAMDFDNAAASFKHLMDAIVNAGVIADDGPKIIEEMTFRQVRCESRKAQRMTVEIKTLNTP